MIAVFAFRPYGLPTFRPYGLPIFRPYGTIALNYERVFYQYPVPTGLGRADSIKHITVPINLPRPCGPD